MFLKSLRIIKNNYKKTIFFTGLSFFAVDYFHTTYKINLAMKNYCKKAENFGNQNLSVFAKSKNLTVILNPIANKRKCKKYFDNYVAPILHCAGFEINIVETENQGHAIKLMESINNTDGVLIAGGSGTIHEAITGLLRRKDSKKIPIGILPLGNLNTSFNQLFVSKNIIFEKNSKRYKEFKILVESTSNILNENTSEASVIRIYNEEKKKSVFALNNFELGFASDLSQKFSKYSYLGNFLSKYYLLIKTTFLKNLNEFELSDKIKIIYREPCDGCSKCYKSFINEETDEAKRRSNSWFNLFRSQSDKKNDYLKIQTEKKLKKVINTECGIWKEKYLNNLINIEIKNNIFRNENYLNLYTIKNQNNLTKINLFNYAQNNSDTGNIKVEVLRARDVKLMLNFDKLNKSKEQPKINNFLNTKSDGLRIDSEIYDLHENIEINSLLKKILLYN